MGNPHHFQEGGVKQYEQEVVVWQSFQESSRGAVPGSSWVQQQDNVECSVPFPKDVPMCDWFLFSGNPPFI